MNVTRMTRYQRGMFCLARVFSEARREMSEREWDAFLSSAGALVARFEAERIDRERRAA